MKVIITGATKGIGRAIAEAFAKEGADIAVNARTATDLDQFKADFAKAYPNISFRRLHKITMGNS